jgi:hypothetical protein
MRRGTVALTIAGAVALATGVEPVWGQTTAVLAGDTITITVPIDAPGLDAAGAAAWKQDAEGFWNGAFDGPDNPYKGCFTLKLVADVKPRSINYAYSKTRHRVLAGTGSLGGVRGTVAMPNRDSTQAYTKALDGMWGSLPEGIGVAHEVGHLLGLGDDYEVISRNPYRTRPRPGRENTMMADGGFIDSELMQRLVGLIRQATHSVPDCWKGTMRSEAQGSQANGYFVCRTEHETEVQLRVSREGAVTGKATSVLTGGPECNQAPPPQARGHTFTVTGRLEAGRFALQFVETSSEGFGENGLFNYTLYISSPDRPTIVVPVRDPCTAEGEVTVTRGIHQGSATGTHRVRLEKLACERPPVG